MTCTQPGCSGTVSDGYCDVCGMAAAPADPAAAAVAAPAPTDGATCTQPGCSGTIADGYCDTCGMAGESVPAGGAPSPMTADEASVATSSARVGSARFGSARLDGDSVATRRARSGSQRLRAARIGAGLTSVPPAPAVDPGKAIRPDPMVPEDKRTCSRCGSAVGRGRDGQPGRTEGFCAQCGQEFSYRPKLQPG